MVGLLQVGYGRPLPPRLIRNVCVAGLAHYPANGVLLTAYLSARAAADIVVSLRRFLSTTLATYAGHTPAANVCRSVFQLTCAPSTFFRRCSAPYLTVWDHALAFELRRPVVNDAYVRALFEAAASEPRVQHHGLMWTAALLFEAKRDPVRMKRQLYRAWQNCPGSKGALRRMRRMGRLGRCGSLTLRYVHVLLTRPSAHQDGVGAARPGAIGRGAARNLFRGRG